MAIPEDRLRADSGVAIVANHLDSFGTAARFHEIQATALVAGEIACIDARGLRNLLTGVARELDAADWAADDEAFARECIEAGMSYERLTRLPPPASIGQEQDRARKELGDLGELVAVLHLLGHLGYPAPDVFGKNVLKLYELTSEHGIDAIAVRLNDEAAEGLAENETLLICEAKAATHESYPALAGRARESFDLIDGHRLQREMRLLAADLRAQGRATAARRVRHFITAYLRGDPRVGVLAVLISDSQIPDPLSLAPLESLAAKRPVRVSLMNFDLDGARADVFAHRRAP